MKDLGRMMFMQHSQLCIQGVVALPMFKDKIALDSGSLLANALNTEELLRTGEIYPTEFVKQSYKVLISL